MIWANMIKFKELHLQNCVYFKDAKLKLDGGDIFVINGLNLKSRERHQSNGSGKSLFFSYLPNIVLGNHPMAIKSNSKSELFTQSGQAQLKLEIDGSDYQIAQVGGKSIRYDMYKDGEHINPKTTATKSERHIRQLLPFSEQEFYTLVYLNSLREFVFQRGKFEQRLAFLTDFFQLDYYDQMREQFQDQLKAIKRVEVEASAYESQRVRYAQEIKELGEEELNLDELERRRNKLRVSRKKQSELIGVLRREHQLLELKNQLESSIGGAAKPTSKRQKEVVARIEAIEKQLSISKEMKRLRKTIESGKVELDKDKSRLDELWQSLFGKNFDTMFKLDTTIESRYSKYRANKERKSELEENIAELEEKHAKIKKPKLSLDEVKEEIGIRETQLSAYSRLMNRVSDGKCPTCDSDIDTKNLKKIADRAEKELKELRASRWWYSIRADLRNEKEQLKEIVLDGGDELEAEYKDYKSKVKHHSRANDLNSRITYIRKELKSNLAKYKQLKSRIDKDILNEDLEPLQDEMFSARRIRKLYNQLDEVIESADETNTCLKGDVLETKSKLDEATDKLRKIETRLDKANTELQKAQMRAEKIEFLTAKFTELGDKIAKYEKVMSDKAVLETLVKVYSSKGIKLHKINTICRILENNLNHYKALLFGENFKFRIEITDKSFDIIVDRDDGVVSDVRLLSGSEGRRFNLLLLISLLPLTPRSRRTNLVILDEMESNADEVSLRLFCERFIPELHKMIPNIMVISPLPLEINGAKRVMVTKDSDGSRIEILKELAG